jgi:hypothetical protein
MERTTWRRLKDGSDRSRFCKEARLICTDSIHNPT